MKPDSREPHKNLTQEVKYKAQKYLRKRMIEILKKHGWNRSRAAQEAGLDRSNFIRLMRKLRIYDEREESRVD